MVANLEIRGRVLCAKLTLLFSFCFEIVLRIAAWSVGCGEQWLSIADRFL